VKLLRQTSLVLAQGQTEKVYEVDLCEVGDDKYVVNFRFGVKGGAIKDGSKTVVPVPLAEAEKIFDKLVASKTKKGFVDANDPRPQASPPPVSGPSSTPAPSSAPRRGRFAFDPDARAKAIVERLQKKTRWSLSGKGHAWPVSRAVWRAGELRLVDAVAPIVDLMQGRGADPMLRYCACWALGRIADPAGAPALQAILDDKNHPRHVSRMAAIALFAIANDAQRKQMANGVLSELPPQLAGPALNGPPEDFTFALRRYLDDAGTQPMKQASEGLRVVDALSLANAPMTRPALLDVVTDLPLRPPFFQRIRHLFKDAEVREDAEMFGLLAFRFEKTQAMFNNMGWSSWASVDGDYVDSKKELRKGDGSRLAYSSRTRSYLRRRVWRTLRRLGQRQDAEAYVKMAVGVLLPFSDDDGNTPRTTSSYNWNQNRTIVTHYDAFAGYLPFNHILYTHSPRYHLKRGGKAFACQGGFKPGDGPPPVREEAFPELWDQVPAGLLHLLAMSQCEQVHVFATKALRANKTACDALDDDILSRLIASRYVVTARFAFDLIRPLVDNASTVDDATRRLIMWSCRSVLSDARQAGIAWARQHATQFAGDANHMFLMATSPFADVRKAASDLLLSMSFSDDDRDDLVGRILELMAKFDDASGVMFPPGVGDDHADIIRDLGDMLLKVFAGALRVLDIDLVLGMLLHDSDAVQAFAGQVLLAHEVRPKDLPEDVIPRLLNAKSELVRGIGLRLFGELDDDVLVDKEDLLVQLVTSKLSDVRQRVRPIVERLAQKDADLAANLAARLVGFVLRKEQHEGLHKDVSETLTGPLAHALSTLTPKTVWRLVHGKTSAAQDLGGKLLAECIDASDLKVREISKLASHDILSIRQAAWAMFDGNVERMKEEIADAVSLLDAKWDDSRAFGFDYFRKQFAKDDLSPAVLVAVCDSVRDDVQRFGRELITKYFEDQDGEEYLLKLSEHPTQDLQLFATNYLERYAAGDVDKLRSLTHYFRSILSRVNKGQVAKARVLGFLQGQAQQSQDIAAFVVEVLERQVLTVVARDRAKMIEVLYAVCQQWPDVDNPLVVRAQQKQEAA